MTDDPYQYRPADRFIVWGRHPSYARGAWIKIAWPEDSREIASRKREGFSLKKLPMGTHPEGTAS